MFRKLVSNLAFSPALVGQIGFYAKRLRKEEATRRIGLIFTALALIVQSFAVFSPPEAANAASSQDLISGGVTSISEYLAHYDRNTNNIRDMFNAIGITRAEIKAAGAHKETVNSKNIPYSFGMHAQFSAAQGEHRYNFPLARGGTGTVYYQPLALWDTGVNVRYGSTYQVFVGHSAKAGWFALMLRCGNLNLKKIPRTPPCLSGTTGVYPKCVTPKKCKVAGKTNLLASDKNCKVAPKKCTIAGKTNLLATDKNCKITPKMCAIAGKTNLLATDKNCKHNAVAACTSLKITKLFNRYELSAKSSTSYGATVKTYVYTIKRDGKVVKTITQSSSKLSNTAYTTQTKQGHYTVELTVKTSVGNKTGSDCIKTFNIPAPKMCAFNTKLVASSPECQPCPGDTTLWIKDSKCAPQVIYTKTANNMTQGNVDATKTTAKAGDEIIYTLNMENRGNAPASITPSEDLKDITEYANVTDTGGGTYDASSKTLTWPKLTIAPHSTQTRLFTVKLLDKIPAIGQGVSDKTSYDCRMDNTFGNTVSIDVDCPVQKKVVEQVVKQLPHTGAGENMIFAGITLAVVAYFYFRARQTKKEIRLIRRDLNAGTI